MSKQKKRQLATINTILNKIEQLIADLKKCDNDTIEQLAPEIDKLRDKLTDICYHMNLNS